ncbi:hypothetical protein ACFHW2_00690 [Actinomadura sp. LOL_016]|uniref:hypothetical protein n=1 Tax=unclassified Actinomadura TaxID=2626254 RepID=UPI003A808411
MPRTRPATRLVTFTGPRGKISAGCAIDHRDSPVVMTRVSPIPIHRHRTGSESWAPRIRFSSRSTSRVVNRPRRVRSRVPSRPGTRVSSKFQYSVKYVTARPSTPTALTAAKAAATVRVRSAPVRSSRPDAAPTTSTPKPVSSQPPPQASPAARTYARTLNMV